MELLLKNLLNLDAVGPGKGSSSDWEFEVHEIEREILRFSEQKVVEKRFSVKNSNQIIWVQKGILKVEERLPGQPKLIREFLTKGEFHIPLLENSNETHIQTITPAQFIEIDFVKLLERIKISPSLTMFFVTQMQLKQINNRTHLLDLVHLDAIDRYQKLQESRPEIIEHSMKNEIASFLAITPVQMSRILKVLKTS